MDKPKKEKKEKKDKKDKKDKTTKKTKTDVKPKSKQPKKTTTKQPKPDLFKYLDRFGGGGGGGGGGGMGFLRQIYGQNPNIILEQQKQLANIKAQNVEDLTAQRAQFEKQIEQLKKEGLRYKELTGEENETLKRRINELEDDISTSKNKLSMFYDTQTKRMGSMANIINTYRMETLKGIINKNQMYNVDTDYNYRPDEDIEALNTIEYGGDAEANINAERRAELGDINRDVLDDDLEQMIEATNTMELQEEAPATQRRGRGRPKLEQEIIEGREQMKEFIKEKRGRPTRQRKEATQISRDLINEIVNLFP